MGFSGEEIRTRLEKVKRVDSMSSHSEELSEQDTLTCCPHCHATVHDRDAFCMHCGTQLSAREVKSRTLPPSSTSAKILLQCLTPGEQFLYVAEQDNRVVFFQAALWFILAAIALYIGYWRAALWLAVIGIGSYLWMDFKRQRVQIGLTDRRVIATQWGKHGQQTADIPLEKIESVVVEEVGRGSYGTLQISGTGSAVLRFENIRDPAKFRHSLQEQLALNSSR